MQTNEKKILMIAMPITLTVMLAVLLTLVMLLAGANDRSGSIPAGAGADTTKANTPITNPGGFFDNVEDGLGDQSSYSRGLSFVSYGNGTCYVSGMGTCTDSFVTVPAVSDVGDMVVAIGPNAFKGAGNLVGISLPTSLRSIGSYAFYNSSLRSVEIPENVTSIGDYAFANCRSLASIGVAAGNGSYSSTRGVLFSGDRSVLICYPSGMTATSFAMPSRVEEIKPMAFYNCNSLSSITYTGSASQYNSIIVGAGNDILDEVRVTYSAPSGK